VRNYDGALLAKQIDEALVNGASTVHRRPFPIADMRGEAEMSGFGVERTND